MKYECAVPFDACRYIEVEADTPEEAAELAMNEVGHACICHQCSDELEVGDALGVYVSDDKDRLLDTTVSGETEARLRARIAELEAELAAARQGGKDGAA